MEELDELRVRLPDAARDIKVNLQTVLRSGTARRGDFELCCLAVSALFGCPTCLVSHEASCLRHGLGDEHVHEAVRIAAVINAAAVALASAVSLEA